MVTTGRWVLLAFSGWTAPQTENEMASNDSSAKGGNLVLRTSHHLGIPGKFFGLGFFLFFFFLFFQPHCTAFGILIPQPEIKLMPL